MKYTCDVEMNSFGGELISLAIVPFDSEKEPLYLVVDHSNYTIHPWVAENVIPKLGEHEPVSRETAARAVASYLRGDETAVVIADWPEDLTLLIGLAILGPGRMVNMPPVTYRYEPCNGFTASKYSKVPHNALEDAIALRDYCIDHGL